MEVEFAAVALYQLSAFRVASSSSSFARSLKPEMFRAASLPSKANSIKFADNQNSSEPLLENMFARLVTTFMDFKMLVSVQGLT